IRIPKPPAAFRCSSHPSFMPNTNPAKMKNPPQSPALSGFQPQNHPLDSTKTLLEDIQGISPNPGDSDENAHRDHTNRLEEKEREASASNYVRLFQEQVDHTLGNPRNEDRDCQSVKDWIRDSRGK